MAMSAARALENYKSLRPAPLTTNDPAAAAAYSDAMMLAIFQAMISEEEANAQVTVTGVQPGSGTATGKIL